MIVNCDIGERGADHPVDRELMCWIGIANLACGGHAGDPASVAAFRALAEEQDVQVSAHLSYPDREGFGRRTMNLSHTALLQALDEQWALLPDVHCVKFHGALYNDSVSNLTLAGILAEWLSRKQVSQVICPGDSLLAERSRALGVQVLAEAFVERRYQTTQEGGLSLVPRSDPRASISDLTEACDQARTLLHRGGVVDLDGGFRQLDAETLCIHSDSPIALELAQAINLLLEESL